MCGTSTEHAKAVFLSMIFQFLFIYHRVQLRLETGESLNRKVLYICSLRVLWVLWVHSPLRPYLFFINLWWKSYISIFDKVSITNPTYIIHKSVYVYPMFEILQKRKMNQNRYPPSIMRNHWAIMQINTNWWVATAAKKIHLALRVPMSYTDYTDQWKMIKKCVLSKHTIRKRFLMSYTNYTDMIRNLFLVNTRLKKGFSHKNHINSVQKTCKQVTR